ncbi:hypothetical protein Tco_1107089 [Tanacetum coccineum]
MKMNIAMLFCVLLTLVNNLDASLSRVINLESKPNVDHEVNHDSKAAGADIGGRGVPQGGSKFVNMIPALMIMDMNDDDYDYGSHRDSAPPPDNARSQHTASVQQVIVTILGAAAVLCFS